MSVTIANVNGGSHDNQSTSIYSGVAGNINTSGPNELACILTATNRTDSFQHECRVTSINNSGLTFVEVFDVLLNPDVGGSFPKSTFHIQLWAAVAASQVTSQTWQSSMSDGFTNLQYGITFSVGGLGDVLKAFDGNVGAALAEVFSAIDVSGSNGTPTVNMDTVNSNDLLLNIFMDVREDSEGSSPLTPALGSGYTLVKRLFSSRSFAVSNLYVQSKSVSSPQSSAAQAAGYSPKNWAAIALAFTSDTASPSSDPSSDSPSSDSPSSSPSSDSPSSSPSSDSPSSSPSSDSPSSSPSSDSPSSSPSSASPSSDSPSSSPSSDSPSSSPSSDSPSSGEVTAPALLAQTCVVAIY